MEPSSLAWLVLAVVSWWMAASAAGVRRELGLLGQGRSTEGDYALVSLLRRLEDDPVALSLRLRLSRMFAATFLPLCLAALSAGLGGKGIAVGIVLGWFIGAATEASGGGILARRIGRFRRGSGYAAWARFTQPWARLVKPLLVLRIPRPREDEQHAMVMAESQATLLTSGGRLGREERRFLRRLLASTSILVTDISTRWSRVDWIDVATSPAKAAETVRESGHTRLPVLEGGRLLGLTTAKDLLPRVHGSGDPGTLREILRPAYFVRQEETMERLLDELQEARVHLAVVVDRLGRYVGVVTMEDVLEEIVGELHDEREREEATP